MSGTLVRVVATHFVAGIVVDNDRCIIAAPILGYMAGKSGAWIRSYVANKGWRAHYVNPTPAPAASG